jgi:uncharacterized membrane protein
MSAKTILKVAKIWGQSIFYLTAGLSHLIFSEFYLPLIPDGGLSREVLNCLAGYSEIGLGLMILIPRARCWASYGLIGMLMVYVIVHVRFVLNGGCFNGSLCLPSWVGWLRLLVIHPLLIIWARSLIYPSTPESNV